MVSTKVKVIQISMILMLVVRVVDPQRERATILVSENSRYPLSANLFCGPAAMTVRLSFNVSAVRDLEPKPFFDWIVVGLNNRNDCRQQGNGDLHYVIDVPLSSEPCATKEIEPGVLENTIRIQRHQWLILEGDEVIMIRCDYNAPQETDNVLPPPAHVIPFTTAHFINRDSFRPATAVTLNTVSSDLRPIVISSGTTKPVAASHASTSTYILISLGILLLLLIILCGFVCLAFNRRCKCSGRDEQDHHHHHHHQQQQQGAMLSSCSSLHNHLHNPLFCTHNHQHPFSIERMQKQTSTFANDDHPNWRCKTQNGNILNANGNCNSHSNNSSNSFSGGDHRITPPLTSSGSGHLPLCRPFNDISVLSPSLSNHERSSSLSTSYAGAESPSTGAELPMDASTTVAPLNGVSTQTELLLLANPCSASAAAAPHADQARRGDTSTERSTRNCPEVNHCTNGAGLAHTTCDPTIDQLDFKEHPSTVMPKLKSAHLFTNHSPSTHQPRDIHGRHQHTDSNKLTNSHHRSVVGDVKISLTNDLSLADEQMINTAPCKAFMHVVPMTSTMVASTDIKFRDPQRYESALKLLSNQCNDLLTDVDSDKLVILLRKNVRVRHIVFGAQTFEQMGTIRNMSDCKHLYGDEKWPNVLKSLARATGIDHEKSDGDSICKARLRDHHHSDRLNKPDKSGNVLSLHDPRVNFQCDKDQVSTDRSTTECVEFAGKLKKSHHINGFSDSRTQSIVSKYPELNIYMGYVSDREISLRPNSIKQNQSNIDILPDNDYYACNIHANSNMNYGSIINSDTQMAKAEA